jgi:1-acyl-sn-glycerol-3-phosphate acyltransferase
MSNFRSWSKLIIVVLILIGHFLWLLLVLFFTAKNDQRGFRIRRKFCLAATRALGVEVKFNGKQAKGPCLYISNHRSLLDPLIQLGYIDTFILSKAEVESYPLLGSGARRTGVLFVERTSEESRKAAIQSIEKLFVSGAPILIYPEGTTNDGVLTAEFRKGTFDLAFRLDIPVVPVMIEYPDASYYYTSGTLIDYFHRIFSKPIKHKVFLQIGTPVMATDKEDLVVKTKQAIDQMIITARKSFRYKGLSEL